MWREIQRNPCHVKYRVKHPSQTNYYPSHLPHPHNSQTIKSQRQKETDALSCRLQFIIGAMTLSVDGFLAKIGSMGRFQWVLVCVVGVMLVPVTFQTLIMTFLGLEPPWRCVRNSSVCNFTRKCPATSCHSFKGFVGICLVILSCSLSTCFGDKLS